MFLSEGDRNEQHCKLGIFWGFQEHGGSMVVGKTVEMKSRGRIHDGLDEVQLRIVSGTIH